MIEQDELTPPGWVDYLDRAEDLFDRNPDWRIGQAWFNALYEVFPQIANQLLATEYDPFYCDDRVGKFLSRALELWKESEA